MSSTNRSAIRQPDDFYGTPPWVVDAILPHLDLTGQILEPGCGSGAIVKRLVARGVDPMRIHGVELDEGRAFACLDETGGVMWRGDFLTFPSWAVSAPARFDLAIGNPPFALALEFIERALTLATTVAFVLRLNFLGSQRRAAWHRAHPSDVYILPRRPSFTEHLEWSADRGERRCELLVPQKQERAKPKRCERAAGHPPECMTIGTDSCEYAWFVYGPVRVGRWSILEVP